MSDLCLGDCRDVMRSMGPASVDAIITDPPYGIGFMGKGWDHGVPGAEFWLEALRVARPGAHLLAFGGTRTFHRLTCAIEDAGWEIRDCIMWVYGSGFPKSRNLDGEWAGFGTALKPAWEPIIVARKPFAGTVAANVDRRGTGALNIDGCRVGTERPPSTGDENKFKRWKEGDGNGRAPSNNPDIRVDVGRWPANLIHDGSDEVIELFPRNAGAFAPVRGTEPSDSVRDVYGERARIVGAFHADSGSAARFFYCAKASREDRNEGLAGTDKRDLNWSSGTQSPGTFQSPNTDRAVENFHPTVKPTALMRWLCRLVTPPGGKVFDPFMGSGSTGKAAKMEGFRFVGCDNVAEYVDIARLRIDRAQSTQQQALL